MRFFKKIFIASFLLFYLALSFTTASKCCPKNEIAETCHNDASPYYCAGYFKCQGDSCWTCLGPYINTGSENEKCRTSPGCCGWPQSSSTQCERCTCGNGIIEGDEQCDLGNLNSNTLPDTCRTNCKNPRCGDKVTDTGEECDDGNVQENDGCYECKLEVNLKAVDLFTDPDYIKQTTKIRGFTPKEREFTPFDDVICEAEIEIPEGKTDLEIIGKLTTPGFIDNIKIVSGILTLVNKKDANCPKCRYYQWKIGGWSGGWTSDNDKMEILIRNKKITCKVEVERKAKTTTKSIKRCVHLTGSDSAKFKVINLIGGSVSELSLRDAVSKGMNIMFNGFESIYPFNKNSRDFAHYVSLGKSHQLTDNNYCKQERIHGRIFNLFSSRTETGGEAMIGIGVNKVDPYDKRLPIIVMHETGHSFCELDDEYIYAEARTPSRRNNCRQNNFWPATYGSRIRGCINNNFFRSTTNSIMRDDRVSQEFNVVSCGYCLRVINGPTNIETYWAICNMSADVIKPASSMPEEKCYIELKINEANINGEVIFNLLSQESLYGLNDGLVNIFSEDIDSDYSLNIYDSSGNLIKKYRLNSGRFIHWDSFSDSDNRGGIKEVQEAIIEPIIPYDKNIYSIKIENNGIETDLNINPDIICERDCKIEGELGSYETDSCCFGFSPSTQEDESFICTNCGDGICSKFENENSCHVDCSQNPADTNQDGKINILDLIYVRGRLNQNIMTRNIFADVNNDNQINILDLISIRNAMNG